MSLMDDFDESLDAPPIGQAHLHSVYEAIAGTLIGFGISLALQQFLIAPLFHLRTDGAENTAIVLIFTIASVLRAYGVRRLFNWLHLRNLKGSNS